jgi:hypothetical protein
MKTSRRFSSVLIIITGLLAASLGPLPVGPADAQEACVAPVPITSVTPGMQGRGLTVVRGTVPEEFSVTVIDVLRDGLAPGIPLIVVEARSSEIDRVGGVWGGMSGSPVYVGDRLLGAVSWGFGYGPSKVVGLTPAAAMLELPDRPTLAAATVAAAETGIPTTARVQTYAAAADGVSAARATSMSPLRVPAMMSGPRGPRFDRVAAAFEAAYPGTAVVHGAGAASAGAAATPIVPGGNLVASLAYGDYTAALIGTATTVCGSVVTGFGHPVMYSGATRLGMHGATVLRVVDDPVFGAYKLANIGAVVGTIDQDRIAGVAGRIGSLPPTLAVTSSITNLDDGRTITGRTDGVYPDDVFGAVIVHGWSNFDFHVFDDYSFSGTSQVSWTIRGLRKDGRPWSVTRENRHADRYDLSSSSLVEAASVAQQLHDNPFEEVRVTEVRYQARAGSPYRALELLGDGIVQVVGAGEEVPAVRGLQLTAGQTLRLRVPVRPYRDEVRRVDISLEIPADAYGSGELLVGNEGGGDPWECLYYPEACGGVDAGSFEDLLASVPKRPRNDELGLTLRLYGAMDGEGQEPMDTVPPAAATTSVRLDDVILGSMYLPVTVAPAGGCPVPVSQPFVDVAPEGTHASAIGCAFALGLTQGVSMDPPTFAPAREVRRDQAASFVANLLATGPRPLPAPATAGFGDLDGNVHREAIERLVAAGIVRGRSSTTFDPSAPVTRAQIATLLVQALEWATGNTYGSSGGPHFRDVGGVHAASIDAAYELGLLQGHPDGTFRPGASTRRDQMASLLVRTHRTLAGVG